MESTIIDLKSRRSIRQFKAEPIDPEKLKKIVEAGTWAPSGMGRQSAKIDVYKRQHNFVGYKRGTVFSTKAPPCC